MTTGVENATDKSLLKQLADEMKSAKTKLPTKWKRDPLPNKCAPGTAVICDQFGNGAQVVEARMVMAGDAGSVCMPLDGEDRGQTLFGGLLHQVVSNETLVLQFTPYPVTRPSDGMFCVYRPNTGGQGSAAYPNTGRFAALYEEFDGTFYYKNNEKSMKMLAAAKAAKAAPQPKGA